MSRFIRWVSALLAFTLTACGDNIVDPPPALPVASFTPSTDDLVVLPDSLPVGSQCKNSVSATRSWSTSTVISAFEILRFTEPSKIDLILTCRNAAGDVAAASKKVTVVKPILSVRVFGLLPGLIGNARVYVGNGAIIDSADISPNGTTSIEISSFNETVLQVRIDEQDPANRRFDGWEGEVRREDFSKELRATRFSLDWTVQRGEKAGQVIPWNPDKAYTLIRADDIPFYRRSGVNGSWMYNTMYIPKTSYPFPVAFERDSSNQVITALDSISAWAAFDSLEKKLGEDVFRPVNFSDLLYGVGLRIRVDTTIPDAARGSPHIVKANGEIKSGYIVVKDVSTLSSVQVMTHEGFHVMGFGHTCSWLTAMFFGHLDVCEDIWKSREGATAFDVAYREVYNTAQELYHLYGARGLAETHQWLLRSLNPNRQRETVGYSP